MIDNLGSCHAHRVLYANVCFHAYFLPACMTFQQEVFAGWALAHPQPGLAEITLSTLAQTTAKPLLNQSPTFGQALAHPQPDLWSGLSTPTD